MDKGFAYLGIPPIFISEIVLALGLLAAMLGGGVALAFRSPLTWLWIAFAVIGVLRTVPSIAIYGVDALRDGVIWGYGLFALLVAAFLPRSGWLRSVPEHYWRWLPWFLIWTPVALVIQRLAGDAVPRIPGTRTALLYLKPGDLGVHLAGASSFLLLGLHDYSTRRRSTVLLGLKEWVLWVPWLLAVVLVGSLNRGGALAVIASTGLILLLRPASISKWMKAFWITVITIGLLFTLNIEIDLGTSQNLSIHQVVTNLQSIAGGVDAGNLDGTRQWRLSWWSAIIDYTVFGEYFWTGKGYGVNLAEDDGFQVLEDGALRSPHNGHLTILARAGVPGIALWGILQGVFGLSLLRAYFRAHQQKQRWWMRVNLWVLAYWLAFLANATFDVFLEGPQQGIWFWSLFGFGIAILHEQQPQTVTTTDMLVGRAYA